MDMSIQYIKSTTFLLIDVKLSQHLNMNNFNTA